MADTDSTAPAPPAPVTPPAATDTRTAAPAPPALVTLPAEIDMANADSLGEQLAAAFAPGVRVVIADMTATTFCDSVGARMLVLAWRRAVASGTELRLLLPNPAVLRVLKILGLDTVLPLYQGLEDALTGAASRS